MDLSSVSSSSFTHNGPSKFSDVRARLMGSSSARLSIPLCSGLRRIHPSSSSSSAMVPSIRPRANRAISCEQKQETIAPSGKISTYLSICVIHFIHVYIRVKHLSSFFFIKSETLQ